MKLLLALLGLAVGGVLIAGGGLLGTVGAGRAEAANEAREAGERSAAEALGAARAWDARERELLERIDELARELETAHELRAARELEWLEFTQAIASLGAPGTPRAPEFLELEDGTEPIVAGLESGAETESRAEAAGFDPATLAAEAAEARAAELLVHLRALLIAEQVLALDVLEVGRVQDGATGPVVVRLLDDRGRPSGTLVAERLRIAVSRAGRVVTLVFEEGFESRGGVSVPFGPPSTPESRRGGVRRMDLSGVDPEPWVEAFPDLIADSAEEPVPDDGKWNLVQVRMRLDELLRGDTTSGHWRVRGLGGVAGGVLRDVQLAQLDEAGHVVRRLFADRLVVEAHARGVRLVLEQGMQERAGKRAPFLDGRYRIYLPRADADAWAAAGIPGLSPARER